MNKSRKSKVFSLSLAQGVVTASTVVLSMVFTRVMTKDDYATYLQTFLAYDFLKPVLTLGLPMALYNLLPGEVKGKKVVSEVMLLLFLAGVIFSLFMIFGGTDLLAKRFNNPNLSQTLKWMTIYPLYTFPILCVGSVLVVNNRVGINAIYNIITGVGLAIAVIIAAFIYRGYTYPLIVKIFFPLFIFPFGIYYCFKYTSGKFDIPELSSLWRILKFSVPLGLATTIASIAVQLSNMIVSIFCSPSDYATFSTGAREIPFITVVTGSIATVIMAEMALHIKNGELKRSLELFRRGTTVSSMFLIPILLFLILYGDCFIKLMYSEAYADSVIPFRIFLFYLPIRIVQYNTVYIAFGQSRAILFRSAVHLIITALCCLFFVCEFGYWGAALGAITASYLWALPYNLYKLSSYFKCKKVEVLPIKNLSRVFLWSSLSAIIASPVLIVDTDYVVKLCLGGFVFILSYFLLMYHFFDDFNIVKSIWKRN